MHVRPATGWGPSGYVYTGFNAFTQKVRDRRTDRQTEAAPNDLLVDSNAVSLFSNPNYSETSKLVFLLDVFMAAFTF